MDKKVALITGCTSGIGFELAKHFARDDYHLILVSKNIEKLNEVGIELKKKFNASYELMQCDLSCNQSVEDLVDTIKKKSRTISALVNNAGIGLTGDFRDLDIKEQLKILQINIVSLTNLTHQLLPLIIDKDHGEILNVASTASFQPGPGCAVYFALKAYVLSFTEALAEELSQYKNLKITCLCPGPTNTAFADKSLMKNTRVFKMGVMKADVVAQSGYLALKKGKVINIPGIVNYLTVQLNRIIPRYIVRKVSRYLLEIS